MSLNRLNTKSANVLENPLKKIYYYEITKLIGMCSPGRPYVCCEGTMSGVKHCGAKPSSGAGRLTRTPTKTEG
jgi:hypothetical protein